MSANPLPSALPEAAALLAAEVRPNIDHIKTEDEIPVDGLFSEKQQRLLTIPLYDSWKEVNDQRAFVAMANVGVFYGVKRPPIVPDVLLSVDVEIPGDIHVKENKSYFTWEYGKAPEVVIEIVSNTEGEELGKKKQIYSQIGILYYIVWDPDHFLGGESLTIFALDGRKSYESIKERWLPEVALGLTVWHGAFEGTEDDWLRWCDREGKVYLTGQEGKQLAMERAERLAAQLRALGVEPAE